MAVDWSPDERFRRVVEAAGGWEKYDAYNAAAVALHNLAKLYPEALGLDLADFFKTMTARLQAAADNKGTDA
jgi:hypothetical protein